LELLALPLDDEHRARRGEGLLGVRNILWAVGGGGAAAFAGGFTREDFMNESFLHMTAAEQVSINIFCIFFFLLSCLFIKSFHLSFSSYPQSSFEG